MIYSNLLKKHYSDWPSLEKAIEALPTAKARGNVFEEFTLAYFTIKKQMYQIAEIYPSADIPDKYRKAFKLGNKQHQDSGVDGLIITNEGKSVSQLGVPVTTNINEIAKFLDHTKGKVRYIFSTYQSADKISEAQKTAKDTFDLIICDEAHRTAGLRSNFSLALEDQFIC